MSREHRLYRLQQEISRLQAQWELIHEQISRLERERIKAIDPLEILRYEEQSKEKQAELEQIREQLEEKEDVLEKEVVTRVEHEETKFQFERREFRFISMNVNTRGEVINTDRGRARQYPEELGNGVVLEMVAIPEGKFFMGSPENEEGWSENESPQHEVSIAPFYMAKYPITQIQWRNVADLPQINNEIDFVPDIKHRGPDKPVVQISWYDAIEFCERLSEKTGHNYRLPSEAEWEYACRAGTMTPFHFGTTITVALANYDGELPPYGLAPKGTYRGTITSVNYFRIANAFGLYDMHGNVYEWCADPWHDNYDGAPTDGKVWIANGNDFFRIIRGGSWLKEAENCRCAYRDKTDPDFREDDIGFRVVCGSLI